MLGPDVDVVSPCLEIPTTVRLAGAGYTPTDYDMLFNGTSAATPHVAGFAGTSSASIRRSQIPKCARSFGAPTRSTPVG